MNKLSEKHFELYKTYCRTYQTGFRLASYILPFRKPKLLEGPNSILKLPAWIRKNHLETVLIVTDSGLSKLGLLDGLMDSLKKQSIDFILYDKTVPNPTVENVEEAYKLYVSNRCEAIVAFGGGSPMDCAKGVAIRSVWPKRPISDFRGTLKVLKKIPPIFAVPTTAGTGSETTVAAIISDGVTHEKYSIMDPVLIPSHAVLDPMLTIGLPPSVTGTTGMDALTHAVEAYIGHSNTKETIRYAEKSVRLVFQNVKTAYQDGSNIQARYNMLKASHYAGIAFTRAYVGYVHALGHAMGGTYSLPHGLIIGITLPYILEAYGSSIYHKLARLAEIANIGKEGAGDAERAQDFIQAIKDLNASMNIPNKVKELKQEDIPKLAAHAFTEANPLYPVPVIFTEKELEEILKKMLP